MAVKKGMAKGGWRPQKIVTKDPTIANQDASIQLIYDLLDSDLKQASSAAKGTRHHATAGIKGAYDTGRKQIQGAGNTVEDIIRREILSMGGDESNIDASLLGTRADLQAALGENARLRTGDLSAIQTEGETQYNVARQAVLGAGREKAQQRVEARTQLEKALAEMRAQEEAARAEVEIARAQADAAKAQASASRSGGGGGGGGSDWDPGDEARFQGQMLENEKLQYMADNGFLTPAQIYQLQATGTLSQPSAGSDPNKPGAYGSGSLGLERFLKNPGTNWGNPKGNYAGPRISTALRNLSGNQGYVNSNNRFVSGYEAAMRRANNKNLFRGLSKNVLRQGIQIAYGKGR